MLVKAGSMLVYLILLNANTYTVLQTRKILKNKHDAFMIV